MAIGLTFVMQFSSNNYEVPVCLMDVGTETGFHLIFAVLSKSSANLSYPKARLAFKFHL